MKFVACGEKMTPATREITKLEEAKQGVLVRIIGVFLVIIILLENRSRGRWIDRVTKLFHDLSFCRKCNPGNANKEKETLKLTRLTQIKLLLQQIRNQSKHRHKSPKDSADNIKVRDRERRHCVSENSQKSTYLYSIYAG